jgi:hypothetical protein
MSIGLSPAYVTLFDAEVKQAYQGKAALVGATRQRRGVEGNLVKFPKVGKGVATLRVPQTDVVPLNTDFSQVTASMQDWNAAEYSDIFMQQKVNFEERSELVQVVANAIGRRQDQLILDALLAGKGSTVGHGSANLTVAKLRNAKKTLDTNNVPPEDRHMIIHANNLSSLLSETSVTSADFNTVRALVSGELDTFLGFKFHTIGDRTEGGLSINASSHRKCLAFHKDAIGYGEGIGPKTEINYVAEKTSFLVNAMLSACSVAIDSEGIVEVEALES